jgi:hypothetical protein
MMKTTLGQKAYIFVTLCLLLYYGIAESRGWASGGTKRKPLTKKQLRQSDIGYRNHIFWYHGFRGK